MSRIEIRIAGFGGQGVILSGYIIGKAASLFDDKFSTLIQSFGPEARGSACSAQVIVSDEVIDYPYIRKTDIFVALSQEAYKKHIGELKSGGTLITEKDMVKTNDNIGDFKYLSIPATRMADQLGRRIVMNMVVVGFFTAVTNLLHKDAVQKAVTDSIPKGTEELNLKAFERGFSYGKDMLNKLEKVV